MRQRGEKGAQCRLQTAVFARPSYFCESSCTDPKRTRGVKISKLAGDLAKLVKPIMAGAACSASQPHFPLALVAHEVLRQIPMCLHKLCRYNVHEFRLG